MAPLFFNSEAAFTIVPPESIISSTNIQVLFFTFPITFITSDFPGAGLLLSTIAKSTFNNFPKALALAVPPTSGATQIILFFFYFFFICLANIGVANKLSTGISKNP